MVPPPMYANQLEFGAVVVGVTHLPDSLDGAVIVCGVAMLVHYNDGHVALCGNRNGGMEICRAF